MSVGADWRRSGPGVGGELRCCCCFLFLSNRVIISDKQSWFDWRKVSLESLSFRSFLLIAYSCGWELMPLVTSGGLGWPDCRCRLQQPPGDRRQSRLAGAAASHPEHSPTQIFSTGSSVVQIFCNNSAAAVRPTLLASSDKHIYIIYNLQRK